MNQTPAAIAERLAAELAAVSARTPRAPTLVTCIGDHPHAQTSPDDHRDRLTDLLLGQLPPAEQARVRAHVADLSAALAAGPRELVREWVATRAAEEDALSQVYAARREAARTSNLWSKALATTLRELDALCASAHRRRMDWVELLERMSRPASANIRIASAGQVAVVVGDGEHQR